MPWAHVKVPNTLQTQIFPFCEDVLARLRIGGCQNQGTINFLELLQHLRPFFWRVGHKKCHGFDASFIKSFLQAISSIQEHFPDSGIIKRLNILSQPDAELFFQQWPTLCKQEEAKNDHLLVLRTEFHKSPTREAFSSFAAQIHGMNQLMESATEKLTVLTRRTEHFSPSKRIPQPMCNSTTNYHPSLPRNLNPFPPALPATSILTLSSPPPMSSQSTTSPPPLQSESAQIQVITSNRGQPTSGFPKPASSELSPTTISTCNQHIYQVLPLSPSALGQPHVHTSHDLVLPPTSAFWASTYPVFTTVDCTWQYILDRVVNPSPLWSSYSPGSLGDYADVKSIWQAWDEGEYIKDVGHKPALRLIDARWGNLESQETHKRKYPTWRPRNDNKVCAYSNFIHKNLTSCTRPAKYGQTFISLSTALMQESSPGIALVKQSHTLKI